ncbi:MAG: hypothetical protein RIN55_00440 [Tissierellaceae bacterium]|nr:hypothetical protein [Tissierellaceae bacterium]
MREIKIKQLTKESFERYGSYINLIDNDRAKLGNTPNEYYRDLMPSYIGETVSSGAICRVKNMPMIIKEVEYSDTFEKTMLPLDGDIVIFVGDGIAQGDPIPLDKLEAFLVPQYTLVKLRIGVWHHAPFAHNELSHTNVLIMSRPRFYVNDIFATDLSEEDFIKIVD